jgi:NTP pyrophosphatase (non-canonical NTP hydrolase)
MRKAEKLFKDIHEWQEEVFPTQTAIGKSNHLQREAKELTEALIAYNVTPNEENYRNLKMEFADVLLLTFSCAGKVDFDLEDLIDFCIEKFNMVRLRTWGELDKDGVPPHL